MVHGANEESAGTGLVKGAFRSSKIGTLNFSQMVPGSRGQPMGASTNLSKCLVVFVLAEHSDVRADDPREYVQCRIKYLEMVIFI